MLRVLHPLLRRRVVVVAPRQVLRVLRPLLAAGKKVQR
jgi:hypothetical protein